VSCLSRGDHTIANTRSLHKAENSCTGSELQEAQQRRTEGTTPLKRPSGGDDIENVPICAPRNPAGTHPAQGRDRSSPTKRSPLELLTRIVMTLLATTMFLWTDLSPSGARASRPIAYLYGDSLARESVDYWTALATDLGYNAKSSTYGGTAPCDFRKQFRSRMRKHPPEYVVVAFTGNNMTPCMSDGSGHALTGHAFYEAYRTALSHFAHLATDAGSVIILVGPPESRGDDASRMNAVYKAVADKFRGALHLYGGMHLTPRQRFRATAPCLSSETSMYGCRPNHRIKIRNPDGTHLCPEAPDQYKLSFDGCPVYAGGALRYAKTLTYDLPPATCLLLCISDRP